MEETSCSNESKLISEQTAMYLISQAKAEL